MVPKAGLEPKKKAKETLSDEYKKMTKQHSDDYDFFRKLTMEMAQDIKARKDRGKEAYHIRALTSALSKVISGQREILGYDVYTPDDEYMESLNALFNSISEMRKERGIIDTPVG